MKYILLAVFLLNVILMIFGCKKANQQSTTLPGNWELQSAQPGMIPNINYQPGNGNELHFTDSTYVMFVDGQQSKSGRYIVEKDNTAEESVCLQLEDDEYTNRIIYDNDRAAQKIFMQIKNNKLSIITGCFALDGGSVKTYIRKR